MGSDSRTLTLTILEREYRVNCPEGAEKKLQAAAAFLNARMAEIQHASVSSGKLPGIDRVAVIAALNISHQFLELQAELEEQDAAISRMANLLEDALQRSSQRDL